VSAFGFNFGVLLLIAALMLLLRWRRVGMASWAVAWWLAIYAGLRLGFEIPVPGSVVRLYMAIVTLALAAYVLSSRERSRQAVEPVLRLIVEPRYRLALVTILALVPLAVAFNVYRKLSVALEAPAFGRTIHPAPPDKILVHEQSMDLVRGENPYRKEHLSPEQFATHLANGRRIYYQNCFFCHGDGTAGDGMFAYGLNPIPTNFTDSSVLQNLQSSFVFWRVAKGGPGMPEEGGPWDSAMPVWERFLTVDEIWDAVLFLYEFNELKPRAVEELAE
jgi:hypothetical protein